MDRPEGQPAIDRRPPMSSPAGTWRGSAGAPTTIIVPPIARPPSAAVIALPLVAVARMTVAPPSFFLGGILRVTVDIVCRAQPPGQRLLVRSSGDRNGPEPHLRGKLNAQMAEPPDPQNGDDVPGHRAAVPERIERRDAGTHQRAGFRGRQLVGNERKRFGGNDGELGIATVVADARHLGGHAARQEIAAPT